MQIPKPKRKKDRALLEEIKTQPCVVCGSTKDIDPSHVKSVGSGGGDFRFNLVAMCRKDHIEWHKVGPFQFFRRHPIMVDVLEGMGWEIDWVKGRLFHK